MSDAGETVALPEPLFVEEGVGFFLIEHASLPYTQNLRKAFFAFQPTAVCVEFPSVLQKSILRCINEFPNLHFIFSQHLGLSETLYLAPDPCDARIEALRLASELGLAFHCVDLDDGAGDEFFQRQPDELAVNSLFQQKPKAYGKALLEAEHSTYTPYRRVREMVRQLLSLKGERVLFVGHGYLLPGIVRLLKHEAAQNAPNLVKPKTLFPMVRTEFVPVPADQLAFAVSEFPALVYAWEVFRRNHSDSAVFDFEAALHQLISEAATQYQVETHETISPAERRVFIKFARNLTLMKNKLRPGIYELITAAKSCVDDDFAVILLELLSKYPPCGEDQRVLNDRYQSLSLYHSFGSAVEQAHPIYPMPALSTLEFHFKKRKQASQEQREAWKEQYWLFSDGGICTWPAESMREEQFFDLIRKRSLQQLTDDHRSVEEFQTSMQDGLDIRETIRNWHTNKIFVKKERRPPGQVGALVVVWEDKPLADPNCWNVTLYSENEKESDISFCSTQLGEEVVGPQISLCYYNCILSVFPAQGIPDVWQEEILQDWETCSRLLIAAGILLSEETFITVVAPNPPDQELREFARDNHKALLYLPLQTFGRKTLKSMRRFHVLSSRSARLWGSDYIDE